MIFVYTKSACPNYESAKQLLESKKLPYTAIDVETMSVPDRERAFGGIRQIPQIFIDGQRVGGLAGLQEALKQLGL